jgi:hypothetical protein
MKKTVQIVAIPLDKEGWSINELVLDSIGLCLAEHDYYKGCPKWQPQQLLVLSDDEIGLGDVGKIVKYPFGIGKTIEHNGNIGIEVECITCTLEDNIYNVTAGTKGRFSSEDVYEILASYPQIPGTIPISKETVQAWIDAGTPGEGSVKLVEGHYIPSTYDQPDNWVSFDVTRPEVDPKGDILLEFSKEITRSMQGYNYGDFEDETKLSIPTNKEIEKKSKDYAYAMKGQVYTEKGQHPANTAWSLLSRGYQEGYKQALKDMGYE